DEMEKYGFKKPHQVIANPLDIKLFTPSENKDKLKKKLNFSKFTLLYTGRLASEKHIDLGIKAFARISKKVPGMDLVIAGRGAEEEALKKLAKELGVEQKVKFYGFLKSQKEFADIYKAADLFIMMSTAETQSIAAMNAMATGSPVVAAASWGLKEYVTKDNGVLVEPNNLEDLTEKIYALYKDNELYKKLSKGGIEFSKSLSIPAIGDIWENTYNSVIKKHSIKQHR
ncbi:glycosyltransferase, partial [Patescibacteria group bacterium]|nr:glycosyltransferase [Patescibacteria group bacterium]